MNCNPWSVVLVGSLLALNRPAPDTQPSPDSRLEICHITVKDRNRHPVTDLKESAFSIFENGVKQEIHLFLHEDLPVSMGLLIDNSGSMWTKRATVESAAQALMDASNTNDEFFVAHFTDRFHIDNPHGKDFTTDRNEVRWAMESIDTRGSSAVREAIVQSIECMKKAHKEKHVLVVVTDGVDNASSVRLDEVVRSAQQSNVMIYAMGLIEDETKIDSRGARLQLMALAEATGGEAFFPRSLPEAVRTAQQVAGDIRSQYMIGYKPSNQALDGTFRKIKVTVNAVTESILQTRTGYYASSRP